MKEIDSKRVSELLVNKIKVIGDGIRLRRINAGLTQQELAFYILTDKCVISNLERGSCTNINMHMLIKIAEVFNINVDELLFFQETTE